MAILNQTALDIKCNLQLSVLNNFEPLNFTIDYDKFKKEIEPWNKKWIFQQKDSFNNRSALLLVGLEGDTAVDISSNPRQKKQQIKESTGKTITDIDFKFPTDLYYDLTCLHPLLDYFQPLGKTMLVKLDAGGWFRPHKDSPLLDGNTVRVVAFIGNNVDHESYEWEMDGKIWPIKGNRAYYVDTRKSHRTHSWADNSIHLIMNIPKTWENVIKLMSCTRYY